MRTSIPKLRREAAAVRERFCVSYGLTMEEAADEIERLRAELAEAEGQIEDWIATCSKTEDQRDLIVAEYDKLHADLKALGDPLALERMMQDAERYRWLRQRIEVREQSAVSGSRRPGLDVRIGHGFLDRPVPNVRPQGRSEEVSRELDAAIDAALREGGAA